jgi:hypothetical protein
MSETKDTGTAAEAHRSHTGWHADHAAWLDEIELWLDEYRRAAGDLEAIGERVRGFAVAVERHAATIETHERGVHQHEHELVALNALGIEARNAVQAPVHERWVDGHAAERDEHLRLKAKVHELVLLIRKLEAATLEGPRSA